MNGPPPIATGDVRLVVDRLEGEVAVVEVSCRGEVLAVVDVPRSALPGIAREGSVYPVVEPAWLVAGNPAGAGARS